MMSSVSLIQRIMFNYADDNTVLGICGNDQTLKYKLEQEARNIIKWCSDNQMEANPSKFQVLIANEKPEKPFSISINGSQIYGEPFVKLLGV